MPCNRSGAPAPLCGRVPHTSVMADRRMTIEGAGRGVFGWAPTAELVLAGLLVAEIAIFAATTDYFFSAANAFEIIRFSTALGLIALAMTPVIVTGGIDLSVGS